MILKHKNTLIIITGGPGTGKSYLAGRIQKSLPELTLLSYDKIKETNWDRFGFDDITQKNQLNQFSLQEFYLTLQKLMRQGKPILTEYPFYQRHRAQLASLIKQSHYRAITILLYADWRTVYERGLLRDKNDYRHPGHLTDTYHIETPLSSRPPVPDAPPSYEKFLADILKKDYDIQLGIALSIDVTDFSKVDFPKILSQIQAADAATE